MRERLRLLRKGNTEIVWRELLTLSRKEEKEGSETDFLVKIPPIPHLRTTSSSHLYGRVLDLRRGRKHTFFFISSALSRFPAIGTSTTRLC